MASAISALKSVLPLSKKNGYISRMSLPLGNQKQPTPHFRSFQEFWPYYLSQHLNPVCRALHYIGTSLGIGCLIYTIKTNQALWTFFLCFIPGYAFAWIGHFIFEKNRPATFKYPRWSFLGDFIMLHYFLTGRIARELKNPKVQSPSLENYL